MGSFLIRIPGDSKKPRIILQKKSFIFKLYFIHFPQSFSIPKYLHQSTYTHSPLVLHQSIVRFMFVWSFLSLVLLNHSSYWSINGTKNTQNKYIIREIRVWEMVTNTRDEENKKKENVLRNSPSYTTTEFNWGTFRNFP